MSHTPVSADATPIPPRAEAALRYAACGFRAHPSCATISMVDPEVVVTHLLAAAIGIKAASAVDELTAGRIAALCVVAPRRRDQIVLKWLDPNCTVAQGEQITEVQYVYGRRSRSDTYHRCYRLVAALRHAAQGSAEGNMKSERRASATPPAAQLGNRLSIHNQ